MAEHPFPRRSADDRRAYGRLWGQLGERTQSVRVLSSSLFSEWVESPIRHRTGVVSFLETAARDKYGTEIYGERQLLHSREDAHLFIGTARYMPLLLEDLECPEPIRDALLDIQSRVAGNAYSAQWRSYVRPISIQITRMSAHADRGDHNDAPHQGTLIGTYTASGSGDVRICYASPEVSAGVPAGSPLSTVNSRPMMIRRQTAGHFYTMHGNTLDKGTLHGARAHGEGRIGVTYRFVHL